MIIAILKIIPLTEKRHEILDVLFSIKGPVQAEAECLACCILEEYGEEQNLFYVEKWRSLAGLERHIRSSSYARILEAMELSSQPPEVSFYKTSETWSFDLIERVRS
ncbi:MAG: antibiotic biosynthesis monooxygenase [Thermodesulfobacteriota bacterium]